MQRRQIRQRRQRRQISQRKTEKSEKTERAEKSEKTGRQRRHRRHTIGSVHFTRSHKRGHLISLLSKSFPTQITDQTMNSHKILFANVEVVQTMPKAPKKKNPESSI